MRVEFQVLFSYPDGSPSLLLFFRPFTFLDGSTGGRFVQSVPRWVIDSGCQIENYVNVLEADIVV